MHLAIRICNPLIYYSVLVNVSKCSEGGFDVISVLMVVLTRLVHKTDFGHITTLLEGGWLYIPDN